MATNRPCAGSGAGCDYFRQCCWAAFAGVLPLGHAAAGPVAGGPAQLHEWCSLAHSPALPLPLQVEWLSGGEKARLALAKFMLTQVQGGCSGRAAVRSGCGWVGGRGVCLCPWGAAVRCLLPAALSIVPRRLRRLRRARCWFWTSPPTTWTSPPRKRWRRRSASLRVSGGWGGQGPSHMRGGRGTAAAGGHAHTAGACSWQTCLWLPHLPRARCATCNLASRSAVRRQRDRREP